jgi:hypothetical protein
MCSRTLALIGSFNHAVACVDAPPLINCLIGYLLENVQLYGSSTTVDMRGVGWGRAEINRALTQQTRVARWLYLHTKSPGFCVFWKA